MAIHDKGIHLPDATVAMITVQLRIPVVPQLLLPFEVLHAGDLVLKELLDDVPIVHVLGHQGHDSLALQLVQLVADELLKAFKAHGQLGLGP